MSDPQNNYSWTCSNNPGPVYPVYTIQTLTDSQRKYIESITSELSEFGCWENCDPQGGKCIKDKTPNGMPWGNK